MKTNVGDVIKLGQYPQNDKYGKAVDPIEWKVLDVQDGKALVVSVKALDMVTFNDKYVDTTWADSNLRTWMNGEFFDAAFTAEEKAQILDTKVSTPDNAKWNTKGGEDTVDKLFALSREEVEKYFACDGCRQAEPTAFALGKGLYRLEENGKCCWWLRTPGFVQFAASRVNVNGRISESIYDDIKAHRAARPAMWITAE